MSKADTSLFHYQRNNELQGIITIHVDYFLSTGNEHFFKDIISKICEKVTVGKECNAAFFYLGLDFKEHHQPQIKHITLNYLIPLILKMKIYVFTIHYNQQLVN